MVADVRTEVSLVFGGEAGQGLQMMGQLLARGLSRGGWHVFAMSEFMSRIRGGSNSLTLRASLEPVQAWKQGIDLCLVLDADALPRLRERFLPGTLVVGDPAALGEVAGLIPLPLERLAKEAGGAILANSIACGFIARLLELDLELLRQSVEYQFRSAAEEVRAKNLAALDLGWGEGESHAGCCALKPPPRQDRVQAPLLLDGSQAVALGCLAGGCTFISSYPMSPSSGMLQILARQARRHGVVVEQAEDEISAINMAIGSWYAGGRAMVTTSGGGFALMGEGLSLAGVMESPMVIHLGQRPGPATGLATRTEQGDLELARYSGHGEFPRALLAPGTLEEAFTCSRHAFAMADASQSPVFILTDQYLLDSFHDLPGLPLPGSAPESAIVATTADYGRYAFTESGISPRGIPGHGEGIVRADSHEHDEEGFLTEDFDLRTAMMDKRLGKLELLRGELALQPVLFGPADFTTLIVGWGSTCAAVSEALENESPPGTAFLHCPQVYPVPDAVNRYLEQAKRIIVVENNATGQFARLLAAETGHRAHRHWLKYNGLPFSVEEVAEQLRKEVAP
jgi:2-oxoglutarate ferredoxin oxidoreductase subunit alpha